MGKELRKSKKLQTMETEYLIIGNSIAGVSAIEGIRELDSQGPIIVISDEKILNYSRPLISYYLGDKVSCDKMSFREEGFYKENNVQILLDIAVQNIDIKKKEVSCNGRHIKFKKLLITTGGAPIIPSIKGLDKIKEGIFTFTKFSDAQRLIHYIKVNKIREAVVLGAGLIGLKCTEGLVERGLGVTIVELADRVLANTFDHQASQIMERALKIWGCKLIKKDTIIEVRGKGGKLTSVKLKSSKSISTRLLILAIGVRPNIDLVKNTSIKYDRGIVVNDFMQTNVKDIYAAGDVAQGKDFLSERNSVIAIWPVAARQGKIAGLNMAGKPTPYEGSFIMNSVELGGIPTISFGITDPPDPTGYEVLSRKDIENNFYRKIVLRDNRIVGAIFLGKVERAGIFSGLIKAKIDVSSFKEELLSDEFGFLVLPAEYRKHLVRGEGILL
jgi:NAD(P)H-nitrite reductase large subunit